MSTPDILAMTLFYLKSSGRNYSLTAVFGFLETALSEWLDYELEVLLQAVKCKVVLEFKVKWLTVTEMETSFDKRFYSRSNGRLLRGIFVVANGIKIPCADYTDANLQNSYYEGYTCNTEVEHLFI